MIGPLAFALSLGTLVLAHVRGQGEWGVAYAPPDVTEARPPILYLHGMWAGPEQECGVFEQAARPFGFLVCPRGNTPNGEWWMWTGTYATVAPQLRAALRAAGALVPGKLDPSGGGTLIGYSNGAYFAVEVAMAEAGKWTGLVLLSMRVELDVPRLRAAGIHRIVLAAGEKDGARASLEALAERTDAAGLPTRFTSLGPGGHEFPPDMSARMCNAVTWVRGADPAVCGGTPR